MNTQSETYWSQRYLTRDVPWDTGAVTRPLREYIDSLENKQVRILIPGAGNAHEAEYLHRNGFGYVHVADLSKIPLDNLKKRCPEFPADHLLHQDFFSLTGQYDLILEQTFFCALPPHMRPDYVSMCLKLLVTGGNLSGVLFDDPLNNDRPPYGGNMKEYKDLFVPAFYPLVMERCYNSIPPRAGREIFIILRKTESSTL